VNIEYQIVFKRLSSVVKARRAVLHLSQEALADAAEIDRTYTSQIERSIANPSLEVLCKLANALDISLGQLLGEVEIPSKK
jgi:transcriptional regulator with XRE-family HTH domain